MIKYGDNALLKIDNIVHKHTHFYRKRMMEGVTDRLVGEINEHLEPVKEQIQNLDRLSFLFLSIGIFSTFLVSILVWFTVSLYAAIFLMVLYLLILALVFYRNHLRQQFLQQKLIVNMSIILYLNNQNIFMPRGVKARVGYMGQWIEFTKYTNAKKNATAKLQRPLSTATFKRGLPGLQNAGFYIEIKDVHGKTQGLRPDFLSFKASQARLNMNS